MEKIKQSVTNKLHHHKKSDAVEQNSGFEVLGLMRTRSRPDIERHISKIPQRDNDVAQEDALPTKLKRNISEIPPDDYDSEDERPPTDAAALSNHQQISQRTGSEFEESGVMRINTRQDTEVGRTPIEQRPSIERQISSIPSVDEPTPNRRARLERSISQIPTNDYDSDDEEA